jgi:hypothetical protein
MSCLAYHSLLTPLLLLSWMRGPYLSSLPPLPFCCSYWMNANVGADGDIYLTVVLNCFVHCVMYASDPPPPSPRAFLLTTHSWLPRFTLFYMYFYYFVVATNFGGLKKVSLCIVLLIFSSNILLRYSTITSSSSLPSR